jgi:integrase
MGVTVREKDGAWWVFCHHQKTRKAKRIGPGAAGRKEAHQVAARFQGKLALGEFEFLKTAPTAPTLAIVARQWEQASGGFRKRGTAITYHHLLDRFILKSDLATRPITEITGEAIESWWSNLLEQKFSRVYLGGIRMVAKAVFARALSLGIIQSNPVTRIDGRLGGAGSGEVKGIEFLSRTDVKAVLEAAARLSPAAYPVLLVMATAGLRLGEARGLQPADLDGCKLSVRREYRRRYVDSPKNGKSRLVDIPQFTASALQRACEDRQLESLVSGRPANWLFNGPGDQPLGEDHIRLALQKACAAAGIAPVRIHALRHTYATLAVQAGVPLLTVSRQLGHKSIAITADIYVNAVPGDTKAAADVFQALLGTQPDATPAQLIPCN